MLKLTDPERVLYKSVVEDKNNKKVARLLTGDHLQPTFVQWNEETECFIVHGHYCDKDTDEPLGEMVHFSFHKADAADLLDVMDDLFALIEDKLVVYRPIVGQLEKITEDEPRHRKKAKKLREI